MAIKFYKGNTQSWVFPENRGIVYRVPKLDKDGFEAWAVLAQDGCYDPYPYGDVAEGRACPSCGKLVTDNLEFQVVCQNCCR